MWCKGHDEERDEAIGECTGYRMILEAIRDDEFCTWLIAYRTGQIVEVYRRNKK